MTIYSRSEELVSRCIECNLAEPESLASLGGSAPGLVDGILSIKDRKDEDDPDVPKTTKALPIIKWTEAFQDILNRVIGARMIPLAYVIEIDPQVPGPAPTLAPNQPHSTEHGSVEGELIATASHTHALFRDDNSVVYYHLEESTRGTSYAASIKPFQRGKDGRGAWKALTSQYCRQGQVGS